MDLDPERTGTEGTTRRRMLGRAGTMAVAGAMVPLTETGAAAATVRGDHSLRSFLNFTVTQEQFGVTAVTAAIQKAPGTPSAQSYRCCEQRSRRSSGTSKRSSPSVPSH